MEVKWGKKKKNRGQLDFCPDGYLQINPASSNVRRQNNKKNTTLLGFNYYKTKRTEIQFDTEFCFSNTPQVNHFPEHVNKGSLAVLSGLFSSFFPSRVNHLPKQINKGSLKKKKTRDLR